MKWLVLRLIRGYQAAISPALGDVCRYEPSCSRYAYEAIERYGVVRGSWLGARRLWRCRPGVAGGYDPVPDDGAAEARAPEESAPERLTATSERDSEHAASIGASGRGLRLASEPSRAGEQEA